MTRGPRADRRGTVDDWLNNPEDTLHVPEKLYRILDALPELLACRDRGKAHRMLDVMRAEVHKLPYVARALGTPVPRRRGRPPLAKSDSLPDPLAVEVATAIDCLGHRRSDVLHALNQLRLVPNPTVGKRGQPMFLSGHYKWLARLRARGALYLPPPDRPGGKSRVDGLPPEIRRRMLVNQFRRARAATPAQ